MPISHPYHEGELAVQQQANETDRALMSSGAIAETILKGALRFIEQQPMAVIGSIDVQGNVWASALFGKPGFLRAEGVSTAEIDVTKPLTPLNDPVWTNLANNQNVGLLVIELDSRRRIRINGRIRKESAQRFIIDVERAYPNCPKYVQRRVWKTVASEQLRATTTDDSYGKQITAAQKSLITNADTFFVASAHPQHGVDASHRGGHAGFVELIDNGLLRIPDFYGNSMFNTLGNFVSYPHAGLLFIDFERGRVLQLTGTVKIIWRRDDPQGETGGTGRYWQFEITRWYDSAIPYRLAWEFIQFSPHIPEPK